MFIVFNILQRREACLHARLTASQYQFAKIAREIVGVTSDMLNDAADAITSYLISSIPSFDIRIFYCEYARGRGRKRDHKR